MEDTTFSAAEDEKVSKKGRSGFAASQAVSIGNVCQIALHFWYWVLLSVIICVGLAWLTAQRMVPQYTRSCSVIIRDDAQSSVGSSSVDLSEIGVGMTNTILEDEMATLKSPDLMEQVVRKLKLTVSYTTPGAFHPVVLYGSNLPVTVDFPDMPDDETASLTLKISPEGGLTAEDIHVNKKSLVLPEGAKLNFGSQIATSSGRIIINKTPFFKPGKEYVINVTRSEVLTATEAYEGEISVEQTNKKSNVVQITCVDASIQRGDEILTALVNTYNQDWIKSRAEVVAVTSNFITDRLNILESELGSVDSNISSFKSTNLIPDLSQASTMYMQQSNSVSNEIMGLSNQLQMARYLRNFVTTEGRNNTVLPVNTGIGSSNIEQLIAQYNTLVMQRNTHLTSTSASNPLVVDIDSRLAALRSSILSSLDNQILSLSNSIGSLERSEQTANARVAANPRQAKYLLTAERQQKVKETLYLYLLQKREENELSQAFTSVNTRILRKPTGPNMPTSPKKMQMYLIGLVVGLLIPFGTIYAMESLNTKIRGRKDLEGLNIPIVGEIPVFKHEGKKPFKFYTHPSRMRDDLPASEDIVVKEGNRDLVNEAFRVLRTNINFITADHLPCVAMLTSFNSGSGKTFISVNLAIALGLKGKRVLLVDGDLRRGSLSRIVKKPRKGVADYLNGTERDVDSLIVPSGYNENVDVLPVGVFPPNPTELLETSRFAAMIEHLRSEYDYVLIDCPPVEMMADAQIIDKVCDRTFFVVRVALFERSMLESLDRTYKTKKFKNMSVILNGADTMSRYGDTYRYGYGYTRHNYKDYEKNYRSKK